MKLARPSKNKPPAHPVANLLGEQFRPPVFLAHIVKQVGRKEFAYDMHLSKTMVDSWLSGLKPNPLDRSKRICEIARTRNCAHLVPAILTYIGGGFDGAVLSAEQAIALRQLAKAVKE